MDSAGAVARLQVAGGCDTDSGLDGIAAADAAPACLFERAGSLVRLTRHQRLTLGTAGDDCLYLVRSGTVAVETAVPARHILGFWYSGEMFEATHLPVLPQLALRAIEASELWRLRPRACPSSVAAVAEVQAVRERAATDMLGRLMVANTMLSSLDGEARVASFLTWTAMRLGQTVGHRVSLRLPMSRVDIAGHLSLNPDTLSRIMTSFKEAGLIEGHGRHGLTIRDWPGLTARTPLAPASA